MTRHVAGLTVAFLLAACGGSLPEPVFSPQPESAFDEVAFDPPPARVEVVPAHPKNSKAVWVDGSWDWTGTRWAWEYGSWVVPPAGATYSKWATKRRADGTLLFARGAWRDHRGTEIEPPPALAVGKAHDEGIIDPEGKTERTAPNQNPPSAAPSPSAAPPPSAAPSSPNDTHPGTPGPDEQ